MNGHPETGTRARDAVLQLVTGLLIAEAAFGRLGPRRSPALRKTAA